MGYSEYYSESTEADQELGQELNQELAQEMSGIIEDSSLERLINNFREQNEMPHRDKEMAQVTNEIRKVSESIEHYFAREPTPELDKELNYKTDFTFIRNLPLWEQEDPNKDIK